MWPFSTWKAFKGAAEYVRPDDRAVVACGEEAPRHASYHRWIILGGIVFALGGMVVFPLGLMWEAAGKEREVDFVAMLRGAGIGAAAGMLLGVALTCLIAPRDFLLGPMGRKWMELIGVEGVLAARAVCLIVVLIGAGLFGAALIYF